MIADLVREDPDCRPAIEELMREILPYETAVFVPPGWDERYVECFGFTLEEVYTHGAEAIEGRLRAAGLPVEEMRIGLPFDLPPAERARRGLTLLRAGYLGEPNGRITPNPEATEMLFDGLRRSVDASAAPGATIQWEFSDAPPWHLRIDHGSASAAPGKAEHADLTFRCSFNDWIDLAAGRVEPWRALVTRRIRPSGSLRMLARAPKLFAG
jgi:hypothetical protein